MFVHVNNRETNLIIDQKLPSPPPLRRPKFVFLWILENWAPPLSGIRINGTFSASTEALSYDFNYLRGKTYFLMISIGHWIVYVRSKK